MFFSIISLVIISSAAAAPAYERPSPGNPNYDNDIVSSAYDMPPPGKPNYVSEWASSSRGLVEQPVVNRQFVEANMLQAGDSGWDDFGSPIPPFIFSWEEWSKKLLAELIVMVKDGAARLKSAAIDGDVRKELLDDLVKMIKSGGDRLKSNAINGAGRLKSVTAYGAAILKSAAVDGDVRKELLAKLVEMTEAGTGRLKSTAIDGVARVKSAAVDGVARLKTTEWGNHIKLE
jgi:hypothetical protein